MAFNYFAIISAAVASFVLGGIYAALFKKQLAALNGPTDTEAQAKQKPGAKSLIGIFAANLVMAFGLAYFVSLLDENTIAAAFWLTLWSSIAFVGPLTIGPVVWAKKSFKWWAFNNAINVICLFVMILILTLWK